MADEVVVQADVKLENSVAPSSTENQEVVVTPPTSEKLETPKPENRVPQSRFNEVIQEKNAERERREALEARLREVESRLSTAPEKSNSDAEVQRLVKNLNMSEDAAKELLEVTRLASERANAPLRAQQRQNEMAEWNREMGRRFPDYQETVPMMERVFDHLPQHMQATMSSSPLGLEMLYNQAKALQKQPVKENAPVVVSGKKDEKIAVSSLPGSGSVNKNQEISLEWIKQASPAEYMRRQSEVNAWLAKGKHS